METISLLTSTNNPKIDQIIHGVIGIFEVAFPGRIRGYYLIGSLVDSSAVATSDIDMWAIFKDAFVDDEEDRAKRLWHACEAISRIKVDVLIRSEEQFFHNTTTVGIKLDSLLLYGEDVRDKIPLPTREQYSHITNYAACDYITSALYLAKPVTFPLDYPIPAGPFYGYDDEHITSGNGSPENGTQSIVSGICRMATAIVAMKTEQYVGKKSDSIPAYKATVNDEWTPFLEELYEKGKRQWSYLIPKDTHDRERLRDLCRKSLTFINHYLTLHRQYILEELHSGDDERKRFAMERLNMVVYTDDEIVKAQGGWIGTEE